MPVFFTFLLLYFLSSSFSYGYSMNKSCRYSGLLILLALSACSSYQVSVNDNLVYTPLPLFDEYTLNDSALENCVRQTIEDKKITGARQLTRLSCTHAGISDLSGLEKFADLQELNLADNNLQSIAPLARLGKLQWVLLRNNQLRDASPLLSLLKLENLDLSGNEDLPCDDLAQLHTAAAENQGSITPPEHCVQP